MESFSDIKARRHLEYATQYLGFTPDSFVDTITLYATEIVEQETEKLREKLKEKFPAETAKLEFKQAFEALEKQQLESVEMIFEKYGKYLKNNLLCVPHHVLLPEDKVHHGLDFVGTDLEKSINNINDLCKEIRCVKYANAVYKAKVANLEAILSQQEKLLQDHETLLDVKNEMAALLEGEIQAMSEVVSCLGTQSEGPAPAASSNQGTLPSDRKRELLIKMEIIAKRLKPQKEN